VLVDSPETSLHRLGTDTTDAWSVEVEAPHLRMRVFAGPRPAGALRRLTARIGRQPRAAPHVFGPWYQPRDDEEAILARLQQTDVPLSVAQTYTHYLPCEYQRGREQAERERVARFHSAGLVVTTYFNPMICTGHTRYAEAAARDALVRDPLGQPYVYRYSTLESFLVSQFDFTSASGRSMYERLLGEARSHGHDGWMEDFGEYTPLDARTADGAHGHGAAQPLSDPVPLRRLFGRAAPHPLCPLRLDRHRALRAGRLGRRPQRGLGLRRPALRCHERPDDGLVRSQHLGLRHRRLLRPDREPADARAAHPLDPGGRGVGRDAHAGERYPDPGERAAAGLGPGDRAALARWAKLRTQLFPYLAAADRTYRRRGLPIMRHLALVHPGDPRAVRQEDEFMFGPDLLAAPVLDPGARRREVYLPSGR
jgi:alpha-glucosidase (family GH31 glycosyl hydrolase)